MDDCIIVAIMQCLTRFKRRSRAKGMTDHQSRKTNMRLMAPTRNKALARKHGRNFMRRL